MQKINVDEELLKKLYEEGKSTSELASLFNVSVATVCRRLEKFGVKLRGGSANKGKVSKRIGAVTNEFDTKKDLIYNAYFNDLMSKRELCLEFNIAFKTLNKLFNKWGWESRTHKEQTTQHNITNKIGKNYSKNRTIIRGANKGKNHSKQNKNYHYIYSKVAFESYPHKCMICGYKKYKSVLEVHHRDEDRSNNIPENLMILCPTCHRLVHLEIESVDKY